MKKYLLIIMFSLLLVRPAFANGGGGLSGGALETTQWANKALLGDILGKDAAIAVNTANQYAKQLQQYATQLQQYAEILKSNFSLPFQMYNDLKNSATNLYGSIRGTGEGVFSYANADSWYNDIRGRTGWLAHYEYKQKTNKAEMKTINDIITKDESELSLAKDAEDASNAATGATAATQAGNRLQMLTLSAIKNQTAMLAAQEKKRIDKITNDTEEERRGNERAEAFMEQNLQQINDFITK